MAILKLTEFTTLIPTAKGTKIDTLKPYADTAEFALQTELIGSVLYTSLESATGDEYKNILYLVNMYLANRAYYEAIPYVDLIQTDHGFAVASNNNIAPASKDRVAALRAQVKKTMDSYADAIITLISSVDAYRVLWTGSQAFENITACVFYTTSELNEGWSNKQREEFLMLKPEIIALQNTTIAKVISADLLASLLDKRASGTAFSVKEKLVFAQIKHILRLHFVDENKKNTAQSAIRPLIEQLSTYLDDNLDDFPLYKNSKEYALKTSPNLANTKDSSIFFGGGM